MHVSLPRFTAAGFLLCALSVSPPNAAGQRPVGSGGADADAELVLELGSPSLAAGGEGAVTRMAEPRQERWISEAVNAEFARQDAVRSGLLGAGIGAFIGAAGFATITYFANEGGQGSEYWPLALGVGALAGGGAGSIVGISYAAW